jgi:hypothetical protein
MSFTGSEHLRQMAPLPNYGKGEGKRFIGGNPWTRGGTGGALVGGHVAWSNIASG